MKAVKVDEYGNNWCPVNGFSGQQGDYNFIITLNDDAKWELFVNLEFSGEFDTDEDAMKFVYEELVALDIRGAIYDQD